LYSACLYSPSGFDIVSGAEDGSVRVWQGTELYQNIPHPSSVWCVMGIPGTDGDFVTGGHDGVLRWFSKDQNKIEKLGVRVVELQSSFESQVQAAIMRRKSGPTNEEIEKAPKWDERHLTVGNSDGQVMVFNKSGVLIAAQWLIGI
jgi:WD40 repeat protein